VVINLGLTAVSLFGVIAIFIGIGLVSKRSRAHSYTVLSRRFAGGNLLLEIFWVGGTLW